MAKGGAFERRLCYTLTEWWDPDASDVCFWRTAGSGGRATKRTRTNKSTTLAHCGDIAATDERGAPLTRLVTLEAKDGYPRASLHHLVAESNKGGESLYHEWIGQARAAARAGRTPFWAVIHHQRYREATILAPVGLFRCLLCDPDELAPSFRITLYDRWACRSRLLQLAAVPFDQFLQTVTPARVRTAADLLC